MKTDEGLLEPPLASGLGNCGVPAVVGFSEAVPYWPSGLPVPKRADSIEELIMRP